MPKSRKKKNQDFQKVKLKVGRKLQKADNVTNASFKTRSVQVVQHIKGTQGNEPTTQRNLNIKDLLNQCHHYNTSVKHDAVDGIRELLTSHPEILKSNLAAVIDRTSMLLVDKDAVVRSAVIKLYRTLIPLTNVSQIRPFFPVISAHICCAMTHIHEDIQVDSLQILDVFLDFDPTLVSDSSSQILPNFIEQISHQNLSRKSGSVGRSLTVKPGGKLHAHKWRIQVLDRLKKLLSSIVGHPEEDVSDNENSTRTNIQYQSNRVTKHLPMPSSFQTFWNNPGFKIRTEKSVLTSDAGNRCINLMEASGMEKFIDTIIPLLMECWMEASSSHGNQQKTEDGGLMTIESCNLRNSVILIIQLLLQHARHILKGDWETKVQNFKTEFKNLMKFFPFSLHSHLGKTGKKSIVATENNEISIHSLNLAVCDVMSSFQDCPTDKITDYLSVYLQSDCYQAQHTPLLLKVTERLLLHGGNKVSASHLMTILVSRFQSTHPLSQEKKAFLMFYSTIIVQESFQISDEARRDFVESLPELFYSSLKNPQMTTQILSIIKDLSQKHSLEITKSFVTSIFGSEERKELAALTTTCQRRIAELLFLMPSVKREIYNHLIYILQDLRYCTDNCAYLLQVLYHRYERRSGTLEETSYYLEFLCQIVCGHISETEDFHDVVLTQARLNRFRELAVVVCREINRFQNTDQVLEVFCAFVSKHVMSNGNIQAEKLFGVITVINKLQIWNIQSLKKFTCEITPVIWNFSNAVAMETLSTEYNTDLSDLFQESAHFISRKEYILKIFLQEMLASLKGCQTVEQVQTVCRATSLTLKEKLLVWPSVDEIDGAIQECLSDLQVKISDLCSCQWWSHFKTTLSKVVNETL